jgi:cell shape-determining protein MreC
MLIAENNELQRKLAASEALVLDRNQLYEENLALKEAFGRSAEPNRVLATVLLRPSATPYDTLIIDVGSDAGIVVGDVVSASGSLLVGKIAQVFAHTSLVRLYSSPGESYEGFLRGSIPIKVVGQGGGSLVADVPYDAKAVEGDSVTLPMLEANTAFIVEHVEQGQGNASPKVYVRLPISAFDLRFVEVWRQTQ